MDDSLKSVAADFWNVTYFAFSRKRMRGFQLEEVMKERFHKWRGGGLMSGSFADELSKNASL